MVVLQYPLYLSIPSLLGGVSFWLLGCFSVITGDLEWLQFCTFILTLGLVYFSYLRCPLPSAAFRQQRGFVLQYISLAGESNP